MSPPAGGGRRPAPAAATVAMTTNALHDACDYPPDWPEAIRLAEEEDELLREKDGDDYLPLHYACFNNLTLPVAKALVRPFPEGVLVKGKNGRTALDYAISQGVEPDVLAFLRSATDAAVKAQQPKSKERVSWRAPKPPAPAPEPEPEPERTPVRDPWDDLPPLYLDDREAFWARAGEGCPRPTLVAIRKACEAPDDQNLDLFMKDIGEVGAKVLGKALFAMPQPLPHTILELTMNDLNDTAMVHISKGMQRGFQSGQLATVRVDTNDIGDDGFEVLAAALPPTVIHLRIGNNRCADAGFAAIAAALVTMPDLRVLNCHGNQIGAPGFASLAEVLPQCPSLEQLCADGNRAGSGGLTAIIAALPRAPKLRFSLELHDNEAEEEAIADLLKIGKELGVEHVSARDESDTEREKHRVSVG